jgi:predicted TIM-barrel fold metal-dependent hydrolase
MVRRIYLFKEDNIPEKAAFPAIDAHNHLWGNWQTDRVIQTLDSVGIIGFCDVTGNVRIEFSGGGYSIKEGNISDFIKYCMEAYPGRFYCFTMSSFAHPADEPLFDDPKKFVDECISTLHKHHEAGAKGLKVLKELGLHFRDNHGRLISCDDERLAPIWDEAGKLGMPVLIHQADPYGFFEPVTEENEHFESLIKYPGWSFADPKFPRKTDLLKQRDNLVRQHPDTTFILPHFANFPENISYVSALLDNNKNIYIDFSARLDELGRQPYSSREFFIKHQDRIIFGSDMPANIETSVKMYRTYFRFLETYDEAFYTPDYDGTFDRARWPVCGIGLPAEVLEKIYYRNIIKIIPSLREDLKNYLPEI